MKRLAVSSLCIFSALACGDRAPKPEAPAPKVGGELELGRSADAAALTELGTALAADDVAKRTRAAHALGIAAAMGADKEPIEKTLVARFAIEPDNGVKKAIVWSLGRAGSAASLSVMVAALGGSVELAAEAGLALGVLGRREVGINDDVRAALTGHAKSPSEPLRYAVAYAFAREHEAPPESGADVLGALAIDAVAETRATALVGLGKRKRGLEALSAALSDPDWRVSVEAVRGLFAIGGPNALAAIEAWLPKETRPHPARVAIAALVEIADDPIAERIARAGAGAANDKTLDGQQVSCLLEAVLVFRASDAKALLACGGPELPAWWRATVVGHAVVRSKLPRQERLRILGEMARDDDARVRAAALGSIGKLASGPERKAVIAVFGAALDDKSVAVAGTAADGLGELALEGAAAEALHAKLTARAEAELKTDGELGQTLVAAIAKEKIAGGEGACRAAAAHENRTIARAGRDCLEALKAAPPSAVATPRDMTLPPTAPGRLTLQTTRGPIVIELDVDVAPRHITAIRKLAGAGFYKGLTFHRVVANFVVQGGDPDGTGWGGPDFVIPAEPSPLPFDQGAVGIADAGPDTGGSQLFIMHSRAPHLEGRYTRIGRVVEGLEAAMSLTVADQIRDASL